MVYFNVDKAKEKTLDFLRYPIPRTPTSITRHLKKELNNYYPNTEDYRTIKSLKENVLSGLIENKLVVKYTEEDEGWETARELIKRHCEATGKPKPRKLKELYQINLFYLGNDAGIYKLPVVKEVNVEIVALLYRFIEERKEFFFWNLLNLFYCYSKDEYKGRIRVKIHGRNFDEVESRALDRLLDYTEEMENLLENIPFDPNIEKAIQFLDEL